MLKKTNLQVAIQFAAGFFLLALPLLIYFEQNGQNAITVTSFLKYLAFCTVFFGIYVLHSYVLFPKLYVKKKYLLYALTLLFILVVLIITRPFDSFLSRQRPPSPLNTERRLNREQRNMPPPENGRHGPLVDIVSVFLFLLVTIVGITKNTNTQLRLTIQRALQAEAEKANAELSFLKAQINPHFLFNILNNIYTLAIIKDDNTGPSIMKLSNMMRYITDEVGDDFVSLEKEVACITDYIDLQQLRLTKKTTVNYQFSGFLTEQKIAPLILMAFVENVFKYGISNHKASSLNIKLDIRENVINFYCENAIHQDKKVEKRTGIGLENTKKRLMHVYPDRHILAIDNNNNLFKVNLTIHL
ncbi:MAG: histidine kinase [Pedobacter sp.]|nr:MAG: histidine kinase [Pedobacter sp.]